MSRFIRNIRTIRGRKNVGEANPIYKILLISLVEDKQENKEKSTISTRSREAKLSRRIQRFTEPFEHDKHSCAKKGKSCKFRSLILEKVVKFTSKKWKKL